MIRFAVSCDHPYAPRAWIWVTVHDTVDELRDAANRHSGEYHGTSEAVFHPATYYCRITSDGREEPAPNQRYAGLVRIARGVNAEIVTHECTHAALSAYRLCHAQGADFGPGCSPDEEALAYLVGQFTGGVTNRLHALGIW